MKTDIVIVGCGVAGLFTALSLPSKYKITILSKGKKEESNSFLAQGGLSTLLNADDFSSYFEDTLKAGHYENNHQAVRMMIEHSPDIVDDLLHFSVEFEKKDGKLLYTKEGAHSKPRILYHQDITGKEITRKLLKEAESRDNIKILEHVTMIDILNHNDSCGGVVCFDDKKEYFTITSHYTVWATGGIGGLYQHSTNYSHLTGDSLVIARKHHIPLQDVSYIQIHPTSFYTKKSGRKFLISESVRGEGGILLNQKGERFTQELQGRDVLTQRIYEQMEKDKAEYVYLSFERIDKQVILEHFPNISEKLKQEGYDILKEPIPVVPAQHYYMGGVAVDLQSRTSLSRLYAVGETCCNGVHGGNRLASNSLLESMVFGKEVAKSISESYQEQRSEPILPSLRRMQELQKENLILQEQVKLDVTKRINKIHRTGA